MSLAKLALGIYVGGAAVTYYKLFVARDPAHPELPPPTALAANGSPRPMKDKLVLSAMWPVLLVWNGAK